MFVTQLRRAHRLHRMHRTPGAIWRALRGRFRFLAFFLVFLLLACTSRTPARPTPSPTASRPTPTPPPRVVLQVAVAANLVTALPDLTRAFQAQTGIHINPIVGSSGKLAQQIANGAPYDVFVSADEGYVDALIKQRHVDAASKRVYAFGRLALVVHHGVGVSITNVASLASPKVRRIAIANPEIAPYGRAARQALTRAGIWPLIEARIVMGESVRQALQFVQSGNADAGLVAYSIARVPGVDVYPVREDLYDAIVQAAGIVSRSHHRAQAQAFLDFLTGPEARAILRRYGYLFPEGEQ